MEVAQHNSKQREQTELELMEISSDQNYKTEYHVKYEIFKVVQTIENLDCAQCAGFPPNFQYQFKDVPLWTSMCEAGLFKNKIFNI